MGYPELTADGYFPKVEELQKTAPKTCRSPVFIGDAVIPWGAETLLLKLLREDAEGRPQDRPPLTF